MYTDNKGNSNSFYTSRYTTHNAYRHNTSNSNIDNVNEIVEVSSNLSINAKCVYYQLRLIPYTNLS